MSLELLANRLGGIKSRLAELSEQEKLLRAELEATTAELIAAMDAQGISLARVGNVSLSISENEVPTVEDWDAAIGYIKENDAWYLFERRMTAAAWRELRNQGIEIPGTTPYKRRTINMRRL